MYLLMLVSLIWPAFVLNEPIVSPDTPAYFKAGKLAVTFIGEILGKSHDRTKEVLSDRLQAGSGELGNPVKQTESWRGAAAYLIPSNAVGVRSAYYGFFVRVLGNQTLWFIVIVQALVALYAVRRYLSAFSVVDFRLFFIVTVTLAAVSSLPWFVSYVMPDLFGGVLIILIGTLLLQPGSHSPRSFLIDCPLIFFCLISHNANLLLAISLVVAIFVATIAFNRQRWAKEVLLRNGILVGLVLAAIVANSLVSYVGFGKVSLTTRAPPFLLARSIADGPGRLYLEDSCRHSNAKYYLCDHLEELSDNVIEFLWSPDGVYMSATPDQRETIRAEQLEIVRNAALARPWLQLKSSLRNIWLNLTDINLAAVRTDLQWQYDGDPIETNDSSTMALIKYISTNLIYLSTVIAIGIILVLAIWFGWSSVPEIVTFVFVALVLNAGITGVVSGSSSRYQARVVWLLPLVAMGYIAIVRRRPLEFQK